ncbi:alpha/beta family hydrolase [uncultured Williamsia sp.]|uniref:alpha/beta hydrolase family protein n=1 Tax=uncultured Williamsia sp. TaxID=259311 RepID=UPI0026397A50|nr:alpha/beta family hydrolase [uncultured Williamsia sp.]
MTAAAHIPFVGDGVDGVLQRPDGSVVAGLVLTHGAGSNRDALLLRRLADALTERGVAVARIDLPYRQRRPKGPPSPSTSQADRDGIVAASGVLRGIVGDVPLLVGGQSYGGRQASMVLAEDPSVADGLLLTSYPLHPPGKPDRARTEHLPGITCPVVVVHGSSDPFATTDEITDAIALIPGPVRLVEIEKTGHDLKPDRSPAVDRAVDAVLTHLLGRRDPTPPD